MQEYTQKDSQIWLLVFCKQGQKLVDKGNVNNASNKLEGTQDGFLKVAGIYAYQNNKLYFDARRDNGMQQTQEHRT